MVDTQPRSNETKGGGLLARFLPPEPRSFRGQRWLKILLRGVHVLFAGILVGAYVFDVEPDVRRPWFLAALLSGIVLVAVDLYETGAFLLQLRGLVVVLKLVLLGILPYVGSAAIWILGVVVAGSVISSHAPSSFRYFLVWGRGKIVGAKTKG